MKLNLDYLNKKVRVDDNTLILFRNCFASIEHYISEGNPKAEEAAFVREVKHSFIRLLRTQPVPAWKIDYVFKNFQFLYTFIGTFYLGREIPQQLYESLRTMGEVLISLASKAGLERPYSP